jgi:LmbE family N-acetylglucosaminyl deacetylase
MKLLYIFPHPDDESFGPAAAMSAQRRAGHEIYLLTLTKGGATKQRHKLGLSVEEMGEVRYNEMLEVEKVLGLNGMSVLNLPDSGLKEMDPREIETVICEHIEMLKPDILVSYTVYGVSGFHDHLVTHAAVKRLYCQMKEDGANYLKRLAMFTLSEEQAKKSNEKNPFNIQGLSPELIDCITIINDEDKNNMIEALKCYKTYAETIEKTGVKNAFGNEIYFEFFMEDLKPPVEDITERLTE